MIVDLNSFKNMYNILLADSLVLKSLKVAHEYVRHKISRVYEKELSYVSPSNKVGFYIPTGYWVMDNDFNNSLSVKDIEAKQFNSMEFTESDITSHIIDIRQYKYNNANRLIITFDNSYPEQGFNSLYFRFNITPLNLKDSRYKWFLQEFISLYAFKTLLGYVDLDKLQSGIASYNLNGVSLNVDSSTIRSVLEDLDKRIVNLYNEFMPLVYATFRGGSNDNQVYFGPENNGLLG